MTNSAFASFILGHTARPSHDPRHAPLLFDLDDTLFKRLEASTTHLRGLWRPDMPGLVTALVRVGHKLGILSSAQHEYIDAALRIYDAQFGSGSSRVFAPRLSTRNFSPLANKIVAIRAIVSEMRGTGLTPVFVDDARLSGFEMPVHYIWVPPEHRLPCRPQRASNSGGHAAVTAASPSTSGAWAIITQALSFGTLSTLGENRFMLLGFVRMILQKV